MKVGVFLGDEPLVSGGAYTFENEILQSLINFSAVTNHSFVIFTNANKSLENTLYPNISVISLNPIFKIKVISKFWGTAIGILKKLRYPKSQFRIVNPLEPLILKSGVEIVWNLTPLCATLEIPYITIVWDLQHRLQPYFPEVSRDGEWDHRERVYGMRLRRAAVIITGTAVGKAEIERFYQVSSDRIKILPYPTPRFALEAPPDNNKQEVLAKYKIPEGYLFYPAQFWPHKNHVGLLRAIQLLREQYNLVFPIVFVGSDQQNQEYIQNLVAQFDLSQQVYFLGFVPQEDLIMLYRYAFALTFVTFFGPDNLPPLEAFALGCPVVASNVSGAEEQLENAALLVDPKDPMQIAAAIKSLHDDPVLRNTIVQRGLERSSRFTGKDFVKGIFAILDEFEPIRRCWDR